MLSEIAAKLLLLNQETPLLILCCFLFFSCSLQDVCILFSAIIVFLLFFNTYIFQAGLVMILINKFKMTIFFTFTYFALCVTLHVWGMVSVTAHPSIMQRPTHLSFDTCCGQVVDEWTRKS